MAPMQYRMFTVGQTLLLVNLGVAEAGDLGDFLAGAEDPYRRGCSMGIGLSSVPRSYTRPSHHCRAYKRPVYVSSW